MEQRQELLARINQTGRKLSKGQKRIAEYIVNHYDKAAFMTASRLGDKVQVSESTVVRFAIALGYDGYPALQKALQEMIRNRLTSVQRMEVTNDQMGTTDILSKVLNMDVEKIRRTLEETSHEEFNGAVDDIIAAKTIYIMGVRSSSALAVFLSTYFHYIFDNVVMIDTSSTSELFEQILRVGKGDVFIAMSFPRYSQKTVHAARYCHDRGAKVIAITDSRLSPIAENAHRLLLARSDMASFVDSLVAPLSIINALIVAIGLKKKDEVANTFERLEKIWDEYNVYEKVDGRK